MRLKELEWRIKAIEKYLYPRLRFSDEWPELNECYWQTRWIQEYWMGLKKEYYAKKKRNARRKLSGIPPYFRNPSGKRISDINIPYNFLKIIRYTIIYPPLQRSERGYR